MRAGDARGWEQFPWWPLKVQPAPWGRAEPKVAARWGALRRLPWLSFHAHDGDECTHQNGASDGLTPPPLHKPQAGPQRQPRPHPWPCSEA